MSTPNFDVAQKAALEKPKLSMRAIINLSMGFMGIQMGFGLQNGNASRILANFGADVHQLSWFWIVAPLTGLIVQPIIGHMGDNTWGKLGRRKPYFLVGAILASLGLIFLPNANIVAGESMSAADFMGISAILWIGIAFLALMDVSFNISMEPFRALVGDMLPKSQGTLGFSVQTILIGFGAILGSFLPWILHNWFGVANFAPQGSVTPNVVWSFYIGAIILMATILYTIATVREYPPMEFTAYQGVEEDASKSKDKGSAFSVIMTDAWAMPKRMKRLGLVQFFSWFALFSMWVFTTVAISQNAYEVEVDKDTYQFALETLMNEPLPVDPDELEDHLKMIEDFKKRQPRNGMYFVNSSQASNLADGTFRDDKSLDDIARRAIFDNPGDFQKAAEDQSQFVWRNEGVLEYILNNRNFQFEQEVSAAYTFKYIDSQHAKGGDWTGVLFGTYNAVATVFAFLLSYMARLTSRKLVHIISLIAGGLGLISLVFIQTPGYMLYSMIGVGMAWASILTMPYALLIDKLPLAKMGVYMGIFNFFIVIPQIINALIGGPIVHALFDDYAIYYLAFGGVLFILAALLTLRIKEPLFGEAKYIAEQEAAVAKA